jgi:uncharacterized protein YhfF
MENLQDKYPGAGTFRFGDNSKMCAALIEQVQAGKKTANCDAWSEYEGDVEALPVVGRCDIATYWNGTPAVVVKTVSVQTVRFNEVTRAMALATGARDLEDWRAAHRALFKRTGTFSGDMELVFEHFEMVEDLAGRGVTPGEESK